MWLIESFKKRKLILFNIFLTIYVITNLVGGERGLVSYFEKKDTFEKLNTKKDLLNTDELTKINDSVPYLKKAVINNDVNEIKDAISKLENTCEFYVERRMNNSIKSLIAGKDINDII